MSVDDILNLRPDLTTGLAEEFLIRWDDRIQADGEAPAAETVRGRPPPAPASDITSPSDESAGG